MQSIYIHIPFCHKKCFYCDFYSITDLSGMDDYFAALKKEIELRTAGLNEKPEISSVFFGGGTPSIVPPSYYYALFDLLHSHFSFLSNAEITLESNPGTIDTDKLKDFRSAGFNRLSIGVQSFVESELEFLQRIHTADEARNAVTSARNAGFENVSVDLIFAIPGQTTESLVYSLENAIYLSPDHISYYSLIYEPGTPLYADFKKGLVTKTNEATDAEFYKMIINKLELNGYRQYEVSNFAKNDLLCRHNLNYWHGREYYGLGASAHGYLNGKRYSNFRNLTKYINNLNSGSLPQKNSELLTSKNKLDEYIYLTLRADGIDFEEFFRMFGFRLESVGAEELNELVASGFARLSNHNFSLTSSGYNYCDEIAVNFLNKLEKKQEFRK